MPKRQSLTDQVSRSVDGQFVCKFCDRELNSVPSLRYHTDVCVFNPDSKRFSLTCCYCNWTAKSAEEIVNHLREKHLHDQPPRYHKGNFFKSRPKMEVVLPVVEQLPQPLSYISDKIFSNISLSDHMPSMGEHSHNLTLYWSSSMQVLHPFSTFLTDRGIFINSGGAVMSSAIQTNNGRLCIALGCADNDFGMCYANRSFFSLRSEVPSHDGWISVYATDSHNASSHLQSLHITHKHGYANHLSWIPLFSCPIPYWGLLASLYVDGDLDIFAIPSAVDSRFWISLTPAVHVHFTRQITTFIVHPIYQDVLLLGFEDGSVRSIQIYEHQDVFSWRVINVLAPPRGWFEALPVASIACNQLQPSEIAVCDPDGGVELWDLRRPEGCILSGNHADESNSVFIPLGFCSDGMYCMLLTSGHRFRCVCLNPDVSPWSRAICDLKCSIIDASISDDKNKVVLLTELGDVFAISDSSKWYLTSREKTTVVGLDYGHIEVVDREQYIYRLNKSSLGSKKANKPGTYWLTSACICDGEQYIVGYGGWDNLFVAEWTR